LEAPESSPVCAIGSIVRQGEKTGFQPVPGENFTNFSHIVHGERPEAARGLEEATDSAGFLQDQRAAIFAPRG
jgi:hypothetical protein